MKNPNNPLVSVVLPVFNSDHYLREAMDSIIAQTYVDWEMIIVLEFDSNDCSEEIIKKYIQKDDRIHLIHNKQKEGLAESLNIGIRAAKGKYIARMDADDLAMRLRFKKQVDLLERFPQIGICGSYQQHIGDLINWVHKPPVLPKECKANLLFDCDLCHSTLMIRKSTLIENNLFYDRSFLAEDFELWTRFINYADICNIPEVLGIYRVTNTSITNQKKLALAKENAIIIAKGLKSNLDIELNSEDYVLLEGWHNPFRKEKNRKYRKSMYQRFELLLRKIYSQNEKMGYYDRKALLSILAAKWRNIKYLEPRNYKREVLSIDDVFKKRYFPDIKMMWETYFGNLTWQQRIRKLVRYLKAD